VYSVAREYGIATNLLQSFVFLVCLLVYRYGYGSIVLQSDSLVNDVVEVGFHVDEVFFIFKEKQILG